MQHLPFRPVLHGDVTALARALLSVPVHERDELAGAITLWAEEADAHRLATGNVHSKYGTGSIMSAALPFVTVSEPRMDDLDYIDCTIMALNAVKDAIELHQAKTRGLEAAE